VKTYVHDIPGRLRVRAERFKSHPAETEELKKIVQGLSGVTFVEYRPASGSLLLRYDPASGAGNQVLMLLSERGYFPEESSEAINPATKMKFSDRVVKEVRDAATATIATYVLEVLIIRFAPPAILLMLPFVRKPGARV